MGDAGLVVIPVIVACSAFGAANASVFVASRYLFTLCVIYPCNYISLCFGVQTIG